MFIFCHSSSNLGVLLLRPPFAHNHSPLYRASEIQKQNKKIQIQNFRTLESSVYASEGHEEAVAAGGSVGYAKREGDTCM